MYVFINLNEQFTTNNVQALNFDLLSIAIS